MISVRGENAMKSITRLSGYSSIVKAGRSRRGSILVFLIVLMVIFAVLGVGMVSMFGSSVLSVFASNSVRRANYLAESGLRYAISEVRNAVATGSTPEAALTNIDDGSVNGKWFNVSPGTARYQVRVYPYPSKTAAGTGVATPFVTTTTVSHSGFPPGFAIPGGGVARLQVGGDLVGINRGVIAADRKTVIYELDSAVTIPLGASIYANLAFPTNASQPITKGSTATPLVLNINAVTAIPQKSGKFMAIAPGSPVDSKLFTYQTAQVAMALSPSRRVAIWSFPRRCASTPPGNISRHSEFGRIT
jgi:nitrate reductase NapE component